MIGFIVSGTTLIISNWKYVWMLGACFLVMFSITLINTNKKITTNTETKVTIKIKEVSATTVYGQVDGQNILLSGWFEHDDFNVDDEIVVSGTFYKIEDIDYGSVNYYKSKGVSYFIEVNQVLFLLPNDTIRQKIINYFRDGSGIYTKYIDLLFLGQKNGNNKDVYNVMIENSIVHLFVISGFHIILMTKVIEFGLKKVNCNPIFINVFLLTILTSYLYLINFTIPATRAFLFYWLFSWNKLFLRKKIRKSTIIFSIAIFFLLLNPYQVYNFSYVFTFSATFCILFINNLKLKNKWFKYFLTTILIFLCLLPLTIEFNNYINLMAIFQIILMTPIISFIYSIMIVCIFFKPVLEILFKFLDWLLLTTNKFNYLLYSPTWNTLAMIFYYSAFSSGLIGLKYYQYKKNYQKSIIIR